ncbi:MAG: permease [Erythrobacter sp. SCN 62-14]|nr:MAG: permease [Erythrobacter sp. SCN 62-14]
MNAAARPLLPIAVAFAGVGFLSVMDAFMKEAALLAGAFTATLLRSAIGGAIIAPIWLARGPAWPGPRVLKLHIERGVITAFMALTFFFALTRLPLAETIALSFIAPIVALYLASVLLGETISRNAIWASVLGFIGTLVIIGGKIGQGTFDQDTALGLGSIMISALLYAYNFIVIRRQAQLAGPVEIATFHSIVSALVLLLFVPLAWQMPPQAAWLPLLAGGAFTVAGALSVAWAYARAEAQVLVPIEYSAFLWASVLGWVFFSEVPGLATWAGTALIIGGCWLITRQAKPAALSAGETPA